MPARPLIDAWAEALYGRDGFYRQSDGPAAHFATAGQGVPGVGELFASALATLADRLGATHILDVGAGRGELLSLLHAARPSLRLTGVDVVRRPAQLPTTVAWVRSPGGPALPALPVDAHTLVVANEWLDVVPCPVVEWDGATWRQVLADSSLADSSLGAPLAGPEDAWREQWWPVADPAPGDRVEIGLTRDQAFQELCSRGALAVLAIDYGHLQGDRPTGGTLIGYRDGATVSPCFDGSTDVTAHVAMDSLGAVTLLHQREAFSRLGIQAPAPSLDLARTAPADYLEGLARRTALAAARDPGGLGGFWWALSCPLVGLGTPPR